MSEFHCKANRPLFLTITAMFLPLGTAYQPMLAYFVLTQQFDIAVPLWPGLRFTPWRFYILVSTAIVVFTLLAMCWLPESPSFLLLMGRKVEALTVLRQMYVCNTGKAAEVMSMSCTRWQWSSNTAGSPFQCSIWPAMRTVRPGCATCARVAMSCD